MVEKTFWKNKRVFVTGHTGFKGSWLALWLSSMGADVTGYALYPPSDPNLFSVAKVQNTIKSIIADVRDREKLAQAMADSKPEIVIHMAAQSLVRDSYRLPVETFSVNVMGTVHVLDGVRKTPGVRAVVNVTTDKCYENQEWHWGYRECDPMGGFDPYSSSKGCSELATAAFRNSYFNPNEYENHGVAVASARAGNVVGGGDWAAERLIPDCIRSLLDGDAIRIRNPYSIRPWQHVLEPLSGYLVLAQKLYEGGGRFAEAWNFGPAETDARPVEWVVQKICEAWGEGATYEVDTGDHPHEACYLKLDSSKARSELDWHSRWTLQETLQSVVDWTRAFVKKTQMQDVCLEQIEAYSRSLEG